MKAIEPLRDLIVCRRYTRPDVSPGGIILPAPWEQPTDCDLWEVIRGAYKDAHVEVGKDVDDFLGARVVADDILLTLPFRGTFSEVLTRRFAEDIFFVAASDVRAVRRWRDDLSPNEDT